MKLKLSVAILGVAAVITGLWAAQQNETMVISLVIGDVKVKSAENAKAVKAKPGMVLSDSSIILTGGMAKAKILFREGNSEILIPENKTVKVADLIAKRISLQSNKNKALLNRVKLKMYKDSSKDDLDAPTAVAGVRGADVSAASNAPPSKPDEMIWDE
jgi:hypothetical protein